MTETEWGRRVRRRSEGRMDLCAGGPAGMIAARAGAIVNIASVHADQTFKGYFPYAAAKSGLVGLTRSPFALEVGEFQVRVNALSPGLDGDGTGSRLPGSCAARHAREVIEVHPLGRIATPAEVANCAAFLLSDEASFVTGAQLAGGWWSGRTVRPGEPAQSAWRGGHGASLYPSSRKSFRKSRYHMTIDLLWIAIRLADTGHSSSLLPTGQP